MALNIPRTIPSGDDIILQDNAMEDSVQRRPRPQQGMFSFGKTSQRGPLLPAYGTRQREKRLLELYRHDYNTLFRGAIAGVVKRIQSTPWEVKSDDEWGDYWQAILQVADFANWDQFIAKLIIDYSRHDAGAFIELIAPGNPLEPIQSAITGIAVLDSLRCWPTGNPEFPVIYWDIFGKYHLMHFTRVVQFVDSPDPDEYYQGYGDCALSRCIAPVFREILVGRYIEQQLDDNPKPGIMLLSNLTDEKFMQQTEKMMQERSTDSGGIWGRTIRLYSMQTEVPITLDYQTFSEPPEKFDFEKYKTIDAREIALGIGLDIQDIWELSGAGLGTGTQSEVLATKSKGKAIGRILKGIERIINQALPDGVEFAFKYQDSEEDQQRADIARTWAEIGGLLASDLTGDERRQLYANQIEAIKDVITDQSGHVRRYNDADPKTDEQMQPVSAPAGQDVALDDTESNDEMQPQVRQLSSTTQQFSDAFISLVEMGLRGDIGPNAVKLGLINELNIAGEEAIRDGLRDGGADFAPGDPLPSDARRELSRWRSQQVGYVNDFVSKHIVKADDTVQVDTKAVIDRAHMWVNKSLKPMYYVGLGEANAQQRYLWVVAVGKEHCVTCLRLNGQVHTMKTFAARNLLPQSGSLVCGGYNCECRLIATDQPARGRLRAVRYVRGRRDLHMHDHEVTQWLN